MPFPGIQLLPTASPRKLSGGPPVLQMGRKSVSSGLLPGFGNMAAGTRHSFRQTQPQRVLLLVTLLILAVFLPACSSDKPPELPFGHLPFIEDDRHNIENPSKDRALATGTGCGYSPGKALSVARKIAEFNLRGLTGEARYGIRFRTVKFMPEPGRICVEVSAQAIP